MLTYYSDLHRHQDGRHELIDGALHPPVEHPGRADQIIATVRDRGLGPVHEPHIQSAGWLEQVHAADYIEFLQTAWSRWEAEHGDVDALPLAWPAAGLRRVRPTEIDGLLGYYSFDAASPITRGTWQAVDASASVALSGAAAVARGEPCAFSLCRPPGHHAARDMLGGYCFVNNAALAAQYLRHQGYARVAILDVDYHHGNGTQAIFAERADVLFVSIHADPHQEYPFFLGHADETGSGAGVGATLNLPLPWNTGWDDGYARALDQACTRVAEYNADVVVVSLGVDTYEGDPISRFRLRSEHFPRLGARIRELHRPTLFVMEGGYAVAALGDNVTGVLEGFAAAPGATQGT